MADVIRPISFRQILDAPNAKELLDEYAAECSLPEIGQIDPQVHIYEAMEKSGAMQAFGVYDGATLIGFVTVLIYTLPHYGKKIAVTESIFLASEHRHKGIGPKMLALVRGYAKSKECMVVQYIAPVGSRFSKLLSINAPRYRRTNIVFTENLA